MHRNRDLQMQMTVQQIIRNVVGRQAKVRRRPDGAILINRMPMPDVLVVPDGESILLLDDENCFRGQLNKLGPDGFADRYRRNLRFKAVPLYGPRGADFRAALATFGFKDESGADPFR